MRDRKVITEIAEDCARIASRPPYEVKDQIHEIAERIVELVETYDARTRPPSS